MTRDLVERRGHGLDLLVVGRDARAHESEGHRDAVEHVDLDDEPFLPEKLIGRIEAGGTGTDDRDPQRMLGGSRTLYRRHAPVVSLRARR